MQMFSYLFILFMMLSQSCNTTKNSVNSGETQTVKTSKQKDTYPLKEYIDAQNLQERSVAIFAGGCFWCTEAAFERIDGVVDVISGYSGGSQEYPTYYQVGAGKTGHAEAIAIFYDNSIIDYKTLLDVLFIAHDPTTLNRQGPDAGPEYRSGIYYQTLKELEVINEVIASTNEKGLYSDPIVTEVAPYKEFWVAEEYHQNYYELHPNHGYVVNVSRPKVEKVIKYFPELIKAKYRK